MSHKSRQWILAEKPVDTPNEKTFKLIEKTLGEVKAGQVLVETLYLSNDPAQRGWIQKGVDPKRLYVPPVELNTVMHARGVAKVIDSRSDKFSPGSLLVGPTGWSEYAILDEQACQPIQKIGEFSETHFLGAFGATGLTAYYGLTSVVNTTAEDVVVISGAAGATGSMAVQICKNLIGCKKVIGMAGSDEKCRWVESLGADICLNYKSPNFVEELEKATNKEVNVYYDNVGGAILDLMLGHMARFGRVAACGSISGYNNTSNGYGIKNWFEIISQRIEIKGFIVLDAGKKMPDIIQTLIQAYKDGKLKVGEENETVVRSGFEQIPQTWLKLFEGANTGKLITKIDRGAESRL